VLRHIKMASKSRTLLALCDINVHIHRRKWRQADSMKKKTLLPSTFADVSPYGVATIGRLLEIIGLFCKRAL